MKHKFTAFGQPVPDDFISSLIADGWEVEEITTESLETLLWYDYQDEQ